MSKQARSVVGKKEMADLILCRPSKRVSSKTQKTTKEMSNRENLNLEDQKLAVKE